MTRILSKLPPSSGAGQPTIGRSPSTQPADVVGPNLRRQPLPPPFEPSEPGPQSGPFPYIKNIFSCIDVIVNLYYHRFKLTNAL